MKKGERFEFLVLTHRFYLNWSINFPIFAFYFFLYIPIGIHIIDQVWEFPYFINLEAFFLLI